MIMMIWWLLVLRQRATGGTLKAVARASNECRDYFFACNNRYT